ncbi:hypothetical protein [Roseofilum sp. Guam]|uniref:hypothetical protein n=1 Tax=Roseofilum sp. Guam TaxID=2821502 RepID=UPI001B23EDF7|nr:hypothetical protein [Roseofilum sp. Guam]MBP0030288.1 hypothetical protein [Roseofilum sp. Guam]
MSDNYTKQAWSLVNEYFHSNQIDPSKYVDHELVRAYLKACQKSTPKGISISKQGNRLYLRFKTATKPATANNSCNESFTRDGCINALAKALAISDKLKETETESEFWEWYESKIKGNNALEYDIITIGQAIEIVKNNYINGYDKCGRDRSNEKSRTNTLANYSSTYGSYHARLNPKLRLTGENIISEITRGWSNLFTISGNQTICSKGFKNAYTAILKLLRDTKLETELAKVAQHFGTLRIVRKREKQAIDLEAFLDFRARVLGLDGYKLSTKQFKALDNRKSWFKAFCINLLYGFRASEFKAILNLDEPITKDGEYFPALSDPDNEWHEIVLDDGFWITDTSGKRHYITVKTANRICRPMIHPDYPNLIKLLGIKDPEVRLPECIPNAGSEPDAIKDIYNNRMRHKLIDYIDQVGGKGFTQTHALRHLANFHGVISGLTVDQRSASLGHSNAMNDGVYKGHQSVSNKRRLLRQNITKEA